MFRVRHYRQTRVDLPPPSLCKNSRRSLTRVINNAYVSQITRGTREIGGGGRKEKKKKEKQFFPRRRRNTEGNFRFGCSSFETRGETRIRELELRTTRYESSGGVTHAKFLLPFLPSVRIYRHANLDKLSRYPPLLSSPPSLPFLTPPFSPVGELIWQPIQTPPVERRRSYGCL